MAGGNRLRQAARVLAGVAEPQAAEVLVRLNPLLRAALQAELRRIASATQVRRDGGDRFLSPREVVTGEFDFLANLDARDLVALIGDEHPQTVAVILSQFSSSGAARILSAMPIGRQAELLCRLADIRSVPADVVEAIAGILRSRVADRPASARPDAGERWAADVPDAA